MAPIRKTFVWDLLPEPNATYCKSQRFVVPNESGRCNDLWQLQLYINPANDTIQFSMNTGTAIERVPEFIHSSRFEVEYDRGKTVSLSGSVHQLNKTRYFISFPPQKASIAALTRYPLQVKFIYIFDTAPKVKAKTAHQNAFRFEWTMQDTDENAMSKYWPPFQFHLGTDQAIDAQLSCSTNNNRIQFRLNSNDVHLDELAQYVSDASVQFTYNGGKTINFDQMAVSRVVPKVQLIYFKTLDVCLTELTMGLRKPFRIDVTFNPCHDKEMALPEAPREMALVPSSPAQKYRSDPTPSENNETEIVNIFESMELSESETSSLSDLTPRSDPHNIPFVLHPELFPPNPQTHPVLRDLNQLLSNQKQCNIIFQCRGDVQIGAHQYILDFRCPAFSKFLAEIPSMDVDAKTMIDALQFIYTGCAPNIASTAERLLAVADVLELPELRNAAENAMIESIRLDQNLEQMLRLVERSHGDSMKPKIVAFFRENVVDLLKQPWFEQLLKDHPDIWFELFKEVCQKG